MPKEKKRLIDETNEKATLFYYEIIGTVILLLSFVSLGKLGKVGSILTTIFKILFGDWYFLFIIYLLFLGVYYLFIHEPFNYKGHRFIGFIFLSIIIILFSHFSIHNYIISTGENYISSTFSIYKNYINTGVSNNLGGGMIGALLFYIINLLMGNIGVILIGIFLAVLSLSLIFKTPFFDIFKWGFKRIKGTGSLLKSFNNFFKYELGKDLDKNDLKLSLNLFDYYNKQRDISKYIDKNTEYTLQVKEKLINILNCNRIKYIKTEYFVSNYIITFNIYILGVYEEEYLINVFSSLEIENKIVNFNKDKIIISINSKYINNLSISDLINKETLKNKNTIPIAKKTDNEIININLLDFNNILIIGNKNDNSNFIMSFITKLFVYNKASEYEIYMYNSTLDFSIYNDYINIYESIYSFIAHIKKYIEERENIIIEHKCNNYNEYIKKYEYSKNLLKKSFIIINSIVEDLDSFDEIEEELIYLTQYSKKCGISFIYSVTNNKYINNVVNSLFNYKILFKTDNDLILKIANADEPTYQSINLYGLGDSYILFNHKMYRTVTAIISSDEQNNIKEYIINKKAWKNSGFVNSFWHF